MAESGPLAAYVTYRSHWSSLPNYVDRVEMPAWATGKEYLTRPSAGQLLLDVRALARGRGFKGVVLLANWGRALVCLLQAPRGSRGSPLLLIWACSGVSFTHAAGFKGSSPLLIGACSRVLLRTPAGVQGGRPT
jgi:hypothetical protein